jgi:putative tryptophan/tyrosine transport system substrate-binding protein
MARNERRPSVVEHDLHRDPDWLPGRARLGLGVCRLAPSLTGRGIILGWSDREACAMRRRDCITLLGVAGAAWPIATRAQQQQLAMPVIGFLHGDSAIVIEPSMPAFHQGLSQSGFIAGRNVAIEYLFAEGHFDRLPAMAADLVRRRVAVIVVLGNISATLAAKAATTTIPIVFQGAGDPVALGYVASLNRPGGNVTGVTSLNTDVLPKRFELLHELLPTASAFALLVGMGPGAGDQSRDAQAAARTLGLQLHLLPASSEGDLDTAFTRFRELRAAGLVMGNTPFFTQQSERLAALALRHAVPAIGPYREFAAAGGLMSYGTDFKDQMRIAGAYTGRILKGAKPADLPVQQATRVALAINMNTAKALGLTFPRTLLGGADEVIE